MIFLYLFVYDNDECTGQLMCHDMLYYDSDVSLLLFTAHFESMHKITLRACLCM